MRVIKQILAIIGTFVLVFLIVTQLSDYIAQLLGLLIITSIIYIVVKKRQNKEKELFQGSYVEFFTITVSILLVIFLTNGLNSNLFFLTYFLLFGMTFIFEPPTVFLFLLGLIGIFITPALQGEVVPNLIKLGSLVLLSPIAFFFGSEFKRRQTLEDEIEEKTEKIISDVNSIMDSEHAQVSEKEMEAIDNIAQNANDLRDLAEKKDS